MLFETENRVAILEYVQLSCYCFGINDFIFHTIAIDTKKKNFRENITKHVFQFF